MFALVGFSAGVVGTSLSNGLIAMRKQLDPNYEAQVLPPSLLCHSLLCHSCYAAPAVPPQITPQLGSPGAIPCYASPC